MGLTQSSNLHLVTGHAGTNHITSADQGAYNACVIGSGNYVLDKGNKFAISVISNNQVRILDGDILFQGRHIRLNENTYVDLIIENGEQGKLRNDLIVCRYTKDSSTTVEKANLVVIKGTSSESSPSDPDYSTGDLLENHDAQADFPLYRIPIDGLSIQTPVCLFGDVKASIYDCFDNIKLSLNEKASVQTFLVSASTSWTADSTNGGYTQTISVSGILETDNPIYDVVLGTDIDANSAYLDAFANVSRLTTANGSVTLWANETAPTTAFTLTLLVVR